MYTHPTTFSFNHPYHCTDIAFLITTEITYHMVLLLVLPLQTVKRSDLDFLADTIANVACAAGGVGVVLTEVRVCLR